MNSRRVLLSIALLLVSSGLFLFANTTIIPHQTKTNASALSSQFTGYDHWFALMGGGVRIPNDQREITVGTSGIGTFFVMQASFEDFACYAAQTQFTYSSSDCRPGTWAPGSYSNTAILSSYIQSRHVEIPYSRVLSEENTTIDYSVARPANFTIIFLPMLTTSTSSYYQIASTNSTITYPYLGWTERQNTPLSLFSISILVSSIGAVALAIPLLRQKPRKLKHNKVSAIQRCPFCGRENMFFAAKCNHCGNMLPKRSEVTSSIRS